MIVARIGGDEFAILIPNASVPQFEYYIKNVQKMQRVNGILPFSSIRCLLVMQHMETLLLESWKNC